MKTAVYIRFSVGLATALAGVCPASAWTPATQLVIAKEAARLSPPDLARQIVALVDSGAPAGIYHGTNSGQASWYEFARAVFEGAGLDPDRVEPTESSQFVRPAPRPAYSVLGHDAWADAGLRPMRPWADALRSAFSTGALGAE
jgi:dTDP-4-dehydrorhamnose reductase